MDQLKKSFVSTKFTNTLVFRFAVSILTGAIVLTSVASFLFYSYTYKDEVKKGTKQVSQLAQTVANSAAIAAYLSESEIAHEVVKGLAQNNIVTAAGITGEAGFKVSSGEEALTQGTAQRFIYKLESPFLPGEQVGILTIIPNWQMIEIDAKHAAAMHTLILTFYTIVVLIQVSFLVHSQLTRPLTRLMAAVHKAQPGIDRELDYKHKHEKNEIGRLVKNSNDLLASVRYALLREKVLREKVQKMGRRYRLFFEEASAGIALVTASGNVEVYNKSFEQLIGKKMIKSLFGSSPITFADMFEDSGAMNNLFKRVISGRKVISGDFRFNDARAEDPRWIHCLFSCAMEEDGNLLIEVVMYDISERARREKRIRVEAEHDPLTNLYNRRAGARYMEEALNNAAASGSMCAFLLIDLDHFKPVNDKFGHEAGDKVLVQTADRMKASVRRRDMVIRWGGDEFLIILKQGHGPLVVDSIVKKLLMNITAPINIDQTNAVRIGASIGIAMYPDHGSDYDQLTKYADQAMYQVKQLGRNGYCIHGGDVHFFKDMRGEY